MFSLWCLVRMETPCPTQTDSVTYLASSKTRRLWVHLNSLGERTKILEPWYRTWSKGVGEQMCC